MSEPSTSSAPPTTVRVAGVLVALEGAVAVGYAVFLVIRVLLGYDQSVASGYGTAAWLVILGGAVLAAGLALFLGRRWGRTIAVVAQLLLLPFVWSLLTGSHQPLLGVAFGVVVVPALVLLFSTPTSRWMAQAYDDVSED
ncbi:hypothetical protein [Rhodococcus sp. NPDC127528]|uniref:hypothetical protein n=1 Tax=unclassified Rhodococcus (in: high G+C Gram-positive bacteria) TaxID=192944 RepID=UPI00362A421C